MAQAVAKGFPSDAFHAVVNSLLKGNRKRHRAHDVARNLRESGVSKKHSHEASRLLLYDARDPNKANDRFVRFLQDRGYMSRQAK